jgi:hypothetical protein
MRRKLEDLPFRSSGEPPSHGRFLTSPLRSFAPRHTTFEELNSYQMVHIVAFEQHSGEDCLTPPDVWAAFSPFPLQMHALGPIRLLIAIVALGFAVCAFILRQTRNALIRLSPGGSPWTTSLDYSWLEDLPTISAG